MPAGASPQVRWFQTTGMPSKSNTHDWVSVVLALLFLSTRMPPDELIRVGQPRPSIHRVMSSMWTHMSPTMQLQYSMNARQDRGWTSLLYGRMGAGPVH